MQQSTLFCKESPTISSSNTQSHKHDTLLAMNPNTCQGQTWEGNNTPITCETSVPLAIFCAVSRIVIAAGYARPLTADMNGVMPLASLGGGRKKKFKETNQTNENTEFISF